MAERDILAQSFLARCGWGDARRGKLAGDASFRHYDRLYADARTAVLMDAPPEREDVRPYMAVAKILHDLGYSAPGILGADVENGFLLLEDLGDDTYTRVFARVAGDTAQERKLYELAVDLLIDLHRRGPGVADDLPAYDDERLLTEASLLVDWYLPAVLGEPASEELRREYLQSWTGIFPAMRGVADTLVLRDYHVDNLMWLPERAGVQCCGLLDFQDAVRGPVAYDLVSLLEDARRDIDPTMAVALKDRYLAAFPNLDRAAFEAAYAALGAQRNAKIIGIFTRLAVRDGKPIYLAHIPRVWKLLESDLKHPALAGIRAWLDRHLPPERRIVPRVRSAA